MYCVVAGLRPLELQPYEPQNATEFAKCCPTPDVTQRNEVCLVVDHAAMEINPPVFPLRFATTSSTQSFIRFSAQQRLVLVRAGILLVR